MGSALFGQAAPDAFGTFELAFFTLFRITAGECPPSPTAPASLGIAEDSEEC